MARCSRSIRSMLSRHGATDSGIGVCPGDHVLQGEGAVRELARRIERDHVLEGRAFRSNGGDLGRLLRVLDEDRLRADVVDDEGGLARLRLRVDRAGDRAERERREVGDRPLRTRARDDRDPVAVDDAEVLEAERQLGDPVPHLAVRAAGPSARAALLRALRLGHLPAHRLAARVPLRGPRDQRDDVRHAVRWINRERLDPGGAHQAARGRRHRSLSTVISRGAGHRAGAARR